MWASRWSAHPQIWHKLPHLIIGEDHQSKTLLGALHGFDQPMLDPHPGGQPVVLDELCGDLLGGTGNTHTLVIWQLRTDY